MTLLDDVTVLILTYNEEANIGRTLAALVRFPRVVILDSHSTDKTSQIVAGFENATFHTRAFDQHSAQWNYGLGSCDIQSGWVLALDADYVVSRDLADEIEALDPIPSVSGYSIAFNYCVYGRRLSSSLYPAHVVLFQRNRGRYEQHGHTQRLVLDGQIANLCARIDHDDRKSLARWISGQCRYAKLEANYVLGHPLSDLRPIDRIRRTGIWTPLLVFFYTLIWKRCIFDGWAGWLYVLQRTLAEMMITLEIVDRRVRSKNTTVDDNPSCEPR